MEAHEANELINSLAPSRQEALLETIRLRTAASKLLGKPIVDERLLQYASGKLGGEVCDALRHRQSRPGNGKMVVIKEGVLY